jgi:hypothetical protein
MMPFGVVKDAFSSTVGRVLQAHEMNWITSDEANCRKKLRSTSHLQRPLLAVVNSHYTYCALNIIQSG